MLAELNAEMEAFVARVGADAPVRREVFCEARYANQLWELDVPLGDCGRLESADVRRLQAAFDDLHQAVFAVSQPGETVETVSWRGDVRIARPAPALPARPSPNGRSAPRRRSVWLGGGPVDIDVHLAAGLPVGATIGGPAIIEEPTTTIVLPAGSVAHVRAGHYLVEVDDG